MGKTFAVYLGLDKAINVKCTMRLQWKVDTIKKTVCICSVDRMCYKKRYNAAVVDRILYLDNKAKLQQFLG